MEVPVSRFPSVGRVTYGKQHSLAKATIGLPLLDAHTTIASPLAVGTELQPPEVPAGGSTGCCQRAFHIGAGHSPGRGLPEYFVHAGDGRIVITEVLGAVVRMASVMLRAQWQRLGFLPVFNSLARCPHHRFAGNAVVRRFRQ